MASETDRWSGVSEVTDRTSFDLGREFGRIDAERRETREHFARINGSIDRTANSLEQLTQEVRRTAEEARLREERALAAREALAAETERKRLEVAAQLTNADRTFTRREKWFGMAAAGCFLLLGVVHFIPHGLG